MHLLFFSFISLISFWEKPVSEATDGKAKVAVSAEPEICRLFGSVYLTSDPRHKNLARYVIYLEPESAFADMQVFKENNKLFADAPGLWHIASNRDFADHIFFVTTNRALADFSIHFTKVRTFSGCRN
ncbi:hypothetical protein [Adhaeribacter aquaticus]|uniref:hypothetical protein n=1 Tax=Adhaeribacter aquaticus TaxID=299567 RepID=UPI0003FA8FF3|nr:hypothetical protein [Adhaeribacter aquaticus]